MRKLSLAIIFALNLAVAQSSFFRYQTDTNAWESASDEDDRILFDPLSVGNDLPVADPPKIWALLVAGSNGFDNYRHQADVCHSYHVLRNHGVSADHIITMMYDDVAHDPQNPYPGKLFNTPAMEDVYAGVKIDYRGDDVTPENFLAVLTGNQTAVKGGNGRVIESNGDKIFVYFADHGAQGILCFPFGVLTVKDLIETIEQMHSQKLYSEMTMYIEACESGSMFNKVLRRHIKTYAVTAANSNESSYGCFCDGDVGCMADLFSINWMVDSDIENLDQETIQAQYARVKNLTDLSHVCRFGDHTIWTEHVSEFQGHGGDANNRRIFTHVEPKRESMWPSRDIPIMRKVHQLNNEVNGANRGRLTKEIQRMQKGRLLVEKQIKMLVDRIVLDEGNRKLVIDAYPTELDRHLDCHDAVVKTFHNECFSLSENPYALKYVYVLANLCELNIDENQLVHEITVHCTEHGIGGVVGIV